MKNRELTRRLHKYRLCYAMILPYMCLFIFFILMPILIAFVLSFTDFNMLRFPSFTGLNNYIRIFLEDDDFLIALRNTLVLACVTGPVSYLAALLLISCVKVARVPHQK